MRLQDALSDAATLPHTEVASARPIVPSRWHVTPWRVRRPGQAAIWCSPAKTAADRAGQSGAGSQALDRGGGRAQHLHPRSKTHQRHLGA